MPEILNRPLPDPLLVDIADYVADYPVVGELAYATAFHCLVDSLACGFQALRHPACTRLLGPVVPGATMAGGSRIPGTSYELDPVQAAFNLGTMVRWLDANEQWFAAGGNHPADVIGGVLVVADYLSRKSLVEGRLPLTVRDTLASVIKAHEIQAVIGSPERFDRAGLDGTTLVRVATAAVVAGMLGGTREQVMAAVSNAWLDGGAIAAYLREPNSGLRQGWAAGDASSRGVRLAQLAMAGDEGCPSSLSARSAGFYDVHFGGEPLAMQRPPGHGSFEMPPLHADERVAALYKKFEMSVMNHFPAGQAEKIKWLVADRARAEATPLHQFLAMMVKN